MPSRDEVALILYMDGLSNHVVNRLPKLLLSSCGFLAEVGRMLGCSRADCDIDMQA